MRIPDTVYSTQITNRDGYMLYDPKRLGMPSSVLFDCAWWLNQGLLVGGAPGRGTTVFVQDGRGELALRHYRRGGLVGRLLGDSYLWMGLAKTRPWREWYLLAWLYQQGLPVPRPVAAHCIRRGLFYRADLLTERLPGRPLADWLVDGPLNLSLARAVGKCIRRFHQAGVFHADLNARNILLDETGRVFLIDFDKGEQRAAGSWQQQNLARLRRSLDKFHRHQATFHFDEPLWQAVLSGYNEGE